MLTEMGDHARNPPYETMGTAMRHLQCLEALGLTVLHVSWPEWFRLRQFEAKQAWLVDRLRALGWHQESGQSR